MGSASKRDVDQAMGVNRPGRDDHHLHHGDDDDDDDIDIIHPCYDMYMWVCVCTSNLYRNSVLFNTQKKSTRPLVSWHTHTHTIKEHSIECNCMLLTDPLPTPMH